MRQSFLPESTLDDVLAAVTSHYPGQINLVQVLILCVLPFFACKRYIYIYTQLVYNHIHVQCTFTHQIMCM